MNIHLKTSQLSRNYCVVIRKSAIRQQALMTLYPRYIFMIMNVANLIRIRCGTHVF